MKSIAAALMLIFALAFAPAQAAMPSLVTPTMRDGYHDWDFLFGTWHGGANLEDGDLKCPHQYILGMTTRLYNPVTHQWTLWWGTRRVGVTEPPQVGHFDANGVGLFYSDDTYAGTPVIVRYKWTHPHGKTWETNWTTDYTR